MRIQYFQLTRPEWWQAYGRTDGRTDVRMVTTIPQCVFHLLICSYARKRTKVMQTQKGSQFTIFCTSNCCQLQRSVCMPPQMRVECVCSSDRQPRTDTGFRSNDIEASFHRRFSVVLLNVRELVSRCWTNFREFPPKRNFFKRIKVKRLKFSNITTKNAQNNLQEKILFKITCQSVPKMNSLYEDKYSYKKDAPCEGEEELWGNFFSHVREL